MTIAGADLAALEHANELGLAVGAGADAEGLRRLDLAEQLARSALRARSSTAVEMPRTSRLIA